MIAQEEIRLLPFAEKLALLETVWAELSTEPDRIEVPEWHQEILDTRGEELQAGRAEVLDWEDAKRQIERAVR